MSWMTATQQNFFHSKILSKQSSSTLLKNSKPKRNLQERHNRLNNGVNILTNHITLNKHLESLKRKRIIKKNQHLYKKTDQNRMQINNKVIV